MDPNILRQLSEYRRRQDERFSETQRREEEQEVAANRETERLAQERQDEELARKVQAEISRENSIYGHYQYSPRLPGAGEPHLAFEQPRYYT